MGAGIGVLSWAAFAVVDDPLAITTVAVRNCRPCSDAFRRSGSTLAQQLLGAVSARRDPRIIRRFGERAAVAG